MPELAGDCITRLRLGRSVDLSGDGTVRWGRTSPLGSSSSDRMCFHAAERVGVAGGSGQGVQRVKLRTEERSVLCR